MTEKLFDQWAGRRHADDFEDAKPEKDSEEADTSDGNAQFPEYVNELEVNGAERHG